MPVYNPLIPAEFEARLAAAVGGDESACAWLFSQFNNRVFRLAAGLLGDAEDAEEVTQDTFVYAFRNLRRFDPRRAGFVTWLCTIAVSRCHNKRRRKWLASVPLSWLDQDRGGEPAGRDVEAALEARGIRRQVWAAVRSLSPKLREAVSLRYFGELTYAEMGQVLGLSPKTAESRTRLALQALRGKLAEVGLEPEWAYETHR